jgi:hypothetical protein
LSAKNLNRFIDNDLRLALQSPILYRPKSSPGVVAHGVRADLLPRVCNVWLKARDAGAAEGKPVLHPQQAKVAFQADLIMRAFAELGIIALVDEATGFQEIRSRTALAQILEQFVAKELKNYISAFPVAYFQELCRLKGIEFREDMRLPPYFGKIINDFVYDRLAPGVRKEIDRVNPLVRSANGKIRRRKHKNYKWLTENTGHPKLLQLVGSQVTLMKMSKTFEECEALINRFHQKYEEMPLIDWLERENAKEG